MKSADRQSKDGPDFTAARRGTSNYSTLRHIWMERGRPIDPREKETLLINKVSDTGKD